MHGYPCGCLVMEEIGTLGDICLGIKIVEEVVSTASPTDCLEGIWPLVPAIDRDRALGQEEIIFVAHSWI